MLPSSLLVLLPSTKFVAASEYLPTMLTTATTCLLIFFARVITFRRAWLYRAQNQAPVDDVDRCRICYEAEGRLIEPCACRGDQRFVHPSCLRKWREQQAQTRQADRCGVCQARYRADPRPVRDSRVDDVQRRLLVAVQAGDLDSVEAALNDGAAVDTLVGAWTHRKPVHYACKYGHLHIVQRLHQSGASLIDDAASKGLHPVHYACMNGNLALVQWLHANGVAINLLAADGRQLIHLACENNHVPLARWLYQMGATITGDIDRPLRSRRRVAPSPMALACRRGSFEIVQWLVESGASVDTSTHGERLLPIHLVCKRGDLRMVKWLHSRGAVLNPRRLRRSYAPVHLADARGHARVVEWLYSQGVPRDQEDPMPQLHAPWRR